tara:strand:+ start:615 stop:1286 length:672 start_codon:yes stop_codon:yes gene_type:complete
MKSNWEQNHRRNNYHYDAFKNDPAYDGMRYIGKFVGDWSEALERTVQKSKDITWRTRNPIDSPNASEDIEAEELDLIKTGAPADLVLTKLDYEIEPIFQKMTDALHVLPGKDRDIQKRVHVQLPGQVWNLHVDKLEKWNKEDRTSVYRFMVMLNDWEPGHFLQYGNYIHTHYRAGEIYGFDWFNTPHCTANAGRGHRSTLLVTGVATPEMHMLFSKYDHQIEV